MKSEAILLKVWPIYLNKNNNGNGENRGGGGGGGGSGTTGENISNIEVREKKELFIYKDLKTTYIFKRTDPILSVNITGNINAGGDQCCS